MQIIVKNLDNKLHKKNARGIVSLGGELARIKKLIQTKEDLKIKTLSKKLGLLEIKLNRVSKIKSKPAPKNQTRTVHKTIIERLSIPMMNKGVVPFVG